MRNWWHIITIDKQSWRIAIRHEHHIDELQNYHYIMSPQDYPDEFSRDMACEKIVYDFSGDGDVKHIIVGDISFVVFDSDATLGLFMLMYGNKHD
jgi:hypothetical protein